MFPVTGRQLCIITTQIFQYWIQQERFAPPQGCRARCSPSRIFTPDVLPHVRGLQVLPSPGDPMQKGRKRDVKGCMDAVPSTDPFQRILDPGPPDFKRELPNQSVEC